MIRTKGPWDGAIGILICLIIMHIVFFSEIEPPRPPLSYVFLVIIDVPLLSSALDDCKIITIDASGCTVSLFFWRRFYPWDSLQTIRFLDFSRARFAGSSYGGPCYCEGVLFSMKRIKKYPQYMDPNTYIFLHYPFSPSCFYIQFTPTRKYVGSPLRRDDGTMPKELPCNFPVDRVTFLSCIEEWGVQVEGLNAPYPPEELETKKKRR